MDNTISVLQAAMLSKNLIRSELAKINKSSHYPFVENEKDTFNVVNRFIEKIS